LVRVTAMEVSAALVTLSVVVAEMSPDLAVIGGTPTPTPVAKPASVIVAMVISDELQVTDDVRFLFVLSE